MLLTKKQKAGLYEIEYSLTEKCGFFSVTISERYLGDDECTVKVFPITSNKEKAEEIFKLFIDNRVMLKGAADILEDFETYLM